MATVLYIFNVAIALFSLAALQERDTYKLIGQRSGWPQYAYQYQVFKNGWLYGYFYIDKHSGNASEVTIVTSSGAKHTRYSNEKEREIYREFLQKKIQSISMEITFQGRKFNLSNISLLPGRVKVKYFRFKRELYSKGENGSFSCFFNEEDGELQIVKYWDEAGNLLLEKKIPEPFSDSEIMVAYAIRFTAYQLSKLFPRDCWETNPVDNEESWPCPAKFRKIG